MKRIAQFSLFILMLTIILPACKEDVYIDWKLQNEKWLETNLASDGTIQKTASGLQYKVIHQAQFPKKPNAGSVIYATYEGKLIDGSTFDSGTNAYLGQVSNLVPGFQEAVKKMNEGSSYIFYIPSKLGYDTISTNPAIPPYSTLIFQVDLISVY